MVLPERNNLPPKNFILPESETEIFHENRNIISPWCSHDAQYIQLCKVCLTSGLLQSLALSRCPEQGHTIAFLFLPWPQKNYRPKHGGKTNKEKPAFIGEGNMRTHFFWAKLRISGRPDLWLWVIWITQTVLPQELRKPNLSTSAPVLPKTRPYEQRLCVFYLLKTHTSGGSNACLVVTGADKKMLLHFRALN